MTTTSFNDNNRSLFNGSFSNIRRPLSSDHSNNYNRSLFNGSSSIIRRPLSSDPSNYLNDDSQMNHVSVPDYQITPPSVIPINRSAPPSIIGGLTYNDRLNRRDDSSKISSSSLQPIDDITDDQLFEAAIAEPNQFAGHNYDSTLYGDPRSVEPNEIEFIEFPVHELYEPNNPGYKLYVATDDGQSKRLTDTLRIAYSKWKLPDNQTGPYVLVNHGVPANQTQWYDVIRRLALAGFRVVVFDMLCMGWSDKPLFTKLEEKNEKLRWNYDVPYVKALADHCFGVDTPFIYLADDWGTGIMYKFMELYSDRLLWVGDQDGIRGGAYPVPEIEAIGRASYLPMDERLEVIKGDKAASPGSFQAAMGAADQTFVQILKTMAAQSNEKYDQWGLRDIMRPFFSVDYERTYIDPRGPSAPYSMPPKFFALKSMADRAGASLRSLDLMPYHSKLNPSGIKFTSIRTNLFLWSGEHDRMMSRNQRLRYVSWMPNSRVFSTLIPRADHFSGVDQPDWIAEQIVAFHQFVYPPGRPGSIPAGFLGFKGVMKGNEREESAAYRNIYDR